MSVYHKNKHKENPTKKTIVLTKARPGINQCYMCIVFVPVKLTHELEEMIFVLIHHQDQVQPKLYVYLYL